MNDFLSAAEIDALFDQASSGRPPVESADNAQGRRTRWLRTVDFSRPSKFGIDQQRRLRRIMEVFCASAATRLSAEHRIESSSRSSTPGSSPSPTRWTRCPSRRWPRSSRRPAARPR